MVRQDARLGHTILATNNTRLEYQLQVNMAVQKKRPGDCDLGIHARREALARGKNDVFTAHHSGLTEAV